jgi:hypothetical protein
MLTRPTLPPIPGRFPPIPLALAGCLALLAPCGAVAAPTAEEIVEKVLAQEDANFEEARNWEYTQHFVTCKLDGEGRVVSEKRSSTTYRPTGNLSYSVGGLSRNGEQAEVGFDVGTKTNETAEEAEQSRRVSEAIRMRDLAPLYHFTFAGEGDCDRGPVWWIDFEPREGTKARNSQQKVLARLHGRFWVHRELNTIVQADCSLVKPMPFVWLDLVSLRQLAIHYEAFRHEGKVWMPRLVEFEYLVRIFWVSNLRQRQTMTADGFRPAPAPPAPDKP